MKFSKELICMRFGCKEKVGEREDVSNGNRKEFFFSSNTNPSLWNENCEVAFHKKKTFFLFFFNYINFSRYSHEMKHKNGKRFLS